MQDTQHDPTGFNHEFGKTWIYPTNLPVRKYQKDIVQEALFKNTMVCLPTGLGKTFIAAVVMYNYFRWYPSGKIIFMATTKPLVKQQVDACYKVVAIPKNTTAELTGNVLKQNRQSIWNEKRVFFLTPQVLRNDLDSVPDLGSKIKCIVIDEAHRARGNHAYCEVIKRLLELNKEFRVLALTATPASNVLDVVNVCQNLLISHLEVRTEDSPDVTPYSHHKSIETVVLKLDSKLDDVIKEYRNILEQYVKILVQNNVIQSNVNSLHKGRLFYLSKEYQEKNVHNRSNEKYKLITKTFATCTILYHGYDLLQRHGMRSFLRFYEDNVNKPLLAGCTHEIQNLMRMITDYVGPPLVCDKLPDGTHLKLPDNCKFGHPKFYKLREILAEHFASHDAHSKVIVFCEYRDTVAEIYASLAPLTAVTPKMFVGQSGITQRRQMSIIDSFRGGRFNTLVSTCIGEEGIDVGFVDLVVCFDVSNKSSVRHVQRVGRTGRDRDGRVVMLVAAGREHQVLQECLREKRHLCDTLTKSQHIADRLYRDDPKMIPAGVAPPTCRELFIAAPSVANFFAPAAVAQTDFVPPDDPVTEHTFKFDKHLDAQRVAQCVHVPSSSKTKLFIDIMKEIEYARYDLRPLQGNARKSRGAPKKQADIRNMFRQCAEAHKMSDQAEPTRIETLLEAKIASLVANRQDCRLCEKFDKDLNFKRALVPIGVLNLKLDLKFDAVSLSNLRRKIDGRLNARDTKRDDDMLSDDSFSSLVKSYAITAGSVSVGEKFASPLKVSSTLASSTTSGAHQTSPDLFDDDFPLCPPEIISTEDGNVCDESVSNSIIEASPSPVLSKRKASQSTTSSFRARKRIKFSATDLFDDAFIGTQCLDANLRQSSSKAETLATTPVAKVSKIFGVNSMPTSSNCKGADGNETGSKTVLKKQKKRIAVHEIFDDSLVNFSETLANSHCDAGRSKCLAENVKGSGNISLTNIDKAQSGSSESGGKRKSRDKDLSISQDNNTSFNHLNPKDIGVVQSQDVFDSFVENVNWERASFVSNDCGAVSADSSKSRRGIRSLRKKNIQVEDIFDGTVENIEAGKNATGLEESTSCEVSLILSKYLGGNSQSERKEITTASNKQGGGTSSSQDSSSQDYSSYSFVQPALPRRTRAKKKITPLDIFDLDESDVNASTSKLSVECEPCASGTMASSMESLRSLDSVEMAASGFVDAEAKVVADGVVSGDEAVGSQDDVYEASFVDDDDDAAAVPGTQMLAVYMQSVRSPPRRGRALRRPAVRHVDDTMRTDETIDLTYAKDSFFVPDDHVESQAESDGMDELERAELELKRRRRNRRGKKVSGEHPAGRRKRVLRIDSDSD